MFRCSYQVLSSVPDGSGDPGIFGKKAKRCHAHDRFPAPGFPDKTESIPVIKGKVDGVNGSDLLGTGGENYR
jgi:hypothetical protein